MAQARKPRRLGVEPVTQRLVSYWHSHEFASIRPFFCQVEAVEAVIWLTEIALARGDKRSSRPAHEGGVTERAGQATGCANAPQRPSWRFPSAARPSCFPRASCPPLRPSSAAALDSWSRSCSIAPVAILPIMTARPMASAGRFSPRGPLGTARHPRIMIG